MSLKKTQGIALLISVLLISCATYYQKQLKFQSYLLEGNIAQAKTELSKDKKAATGKNKLLYHMNMGTLSWLNQNPTESNTYFNQADYIAEDFVKQPYQSALSLLVNPMIAEYKPETYEVVMIHYYKAMNWIQLKDYENAIVECKRLNLTLNQLNDKYKKTEHKYSNDAFGYVLMGLVYEAAEEYNNAYIAYKNAYNAYETSYSKLFGIEAPKQLKLDLLRMAKRNGFNTDVGYYETKFNLKTPETFEKELVFFWNNGLCPVKGENSINFVATQSGGALVFSNQELGLTFSFPMNAKDPKQSALADLKIVRVAFPKFVERAKVYNKAQMKLGNQTYTFEKAEDINQIAFECLNDRRMRDIGEGILRLATKKAAELAMRKQNQDAGALVGIANAITEKADTRNWQTLPYEIQYVRVPIRGNETQAQLVYSGKRGEKQQNFNLSPQKGLQFIAFHTLESYAPVY
jgi:uncharacterized protein